MQTKKLATILLVFFFGFLAGAFLMDYVRDRTIQSLSSTVYGQALEAYGHGDNHRAIGLFYASTIYSPNRYLPYAYLGDIYAKFGVDKVAIDLYNKAIANTYLQQDFGVFGDIDNGSIYKDRLTIQDKINKLKNSKTQN